MRAYIWVFLVVVVACREDKATPVQTNSPSTPTLYKSWKAVKVLHEQTDLTADFSSFKITITAPASGVMTLPFAVTGNNGLTVWPRSGTFTTNGSETMLRDDQTPISFKLYQDSLQFNFDYHGQGFVNRDQPDLDGSWKMFFIIQ